jgi:hypothetical protein
MSNALPKTEIRRLRIHSNPTLDAGGIQSFISCWNLFACSYGFPPAVANMKNAHNIAVNGKEYAIDMRFPSVEEMPNLKRNVRILGGDRNPKVRRPGREYRSLQKVLRSVEDEFCYLAAFWLGKIDRRKPLSVLAE